jgi:hypothetical protein
METTFSVRAAAKLIDSDERTLRREISRGNLTVEQISPHRSRVQLDELRRFVEANPNRGFVPPAVSANGQDEQAPEFAAAPIVAQLPQPMAEPSVPNAAQSTVTIALEHFEALVAARAELEFIRRHFDLKWRGDVQA